ncbi:sugar phosphate isomerase/epimerase family protein [Natronomonas sp. EA1]|uniref:sugar phosphate isomerase/epimerase family protein n=1 Tax=Natronomonas sp. EA1 TaxID=3421655 RepID=UPI003EBA2C27
MTEIAFQLYSLHGIEDPLPVVLDRVGRTGFDGVEFAGLGGTEPAAVAAALDEHGLAAAGAHVGLETLESTDAVARTYRNLGCRQLTVPWLPPEVFDSRSAVAAAADRLDSIARSVGAHGCQLNYHNHDHEFRTLGDGSALDALLALTEVGFQLDLGWAGVAGYDPLALLDRYGDRIDLVHLKDYDAAAAAPAPVGAGDLDLGATVAAVRDHDVDWLIYEAEHAPDSYATLDRAAAFVEEYW